MSVVRGNETEWRALEVPGVSVRILRSDKATGESTALVRLEPGSRFPAKHTASTEGGCVFLVTLPKPVVILKD